MLFCTDLKAFGAFVEHCWLKNPFTESPASPKKQRKERDLLSWRLLVMYIQSSLNILQLQVKQTSRSKRWLCQSHIHGEFFIPGTWQQKYRYLHNTAFLFRIKHGRKDLNWDNRLLMKGTNISHSQLNEYMLIGSWVEWQPRKLHVKSIKSHYS